MKIEKTVSTMGIALLVGFALPAAVFFRKLPAAGPTGAEQELIAFSYQPLTVPLPKVPPLFSGGECPVQPSGQNASPVPARAPTAAIFPPGPIPAAGGGALPPAVVKRGPEPPVVSLIYSDGQTAMAILDGHVLRQGGSLGPHRVVKITENRVLIRTNGKDLWLNIE